MAGPWGALYDAVNDWSERTDPLIGAADDPRFMGRALFRTTDNIDVQIIVSGGLANRYSVGLQAGGMIRFQGRGSGNTFRFRADTLASFADGNWHVAVWFADMTAGVLLVELWVDRVKQALDISQGPSAGDIQYTNSGRPQCLSRHADLGGRLFDGDLSDVHFWTDHIVDPSVPANQDLFWDANGIAKDLGADGTATGLPACQAAFRIPSLAAGADSHGINTGTGGAYTVYGGREFSSQHPPPYAGVVTSTIVPRMVTGGINMGEGFRHA